MPNADKIHFRPGRTDDLVLIHEKAKEWLLDDENLAAEQFLIAEDSKDNIIGFGRIKPYKSCYELGTVGVAPPWRGRGLGRRIIKALISRFPVPEVWITTDLVSYFERLGFHLKEKGPEELFEKIGSTCRVKGRRNVRVMLLKK